SVGQRSVRQVGRALAVAASACHQQALAAGLRVVGHAGPVIVVHHKAAHGDEFASGDRRVHCVVAVGGKVCQVEVVLGVGGAGQHGVLHVYSAACAENSG